MKQLLLLIFSLFISLSVLAGKDVTKFLGIPVDGPKADMVNALKAKGFQQNTVGDIEYFSGRFNGMDVRVYISIDDGKVSRIMVCDANTMNEGDIKIRFNTLCRQFNANGKYLALDSYTIPDSEDIAIEMVAHNKRYEAIFYQLPEGESLEQLKQHIKQEIQDKYTSQQLESPSEEIEKEISADTFELLYNALAKKPVWFMINKHYGEYFISMFYDNELNRAQGQDL